MVLAKIDSSEVETWHCSNIQRVAKWASIMSIIHIEKLRFINNDKLDIFWKIWKPVLDHLGMW